MFSLFLKGLKKCSYETLEFEFIHFFGSNEKRSIERYLGRLEQNLSYGSANMTRVNQTSGKVAMFHYSNKRKVLGKKGLLEILGYVSRVREGNETKFILHHENMPYYTEQVTLESAVSIPEVNENNITKDKMCVSSLLVENLNQDILRNEGGGGGTLDCESPHNIEIEKKEEEVIDSTHTNLKTNVILLEDEAKRISDLENTFAELHKKVRLCQHGHESETAIFCSVCHERIVSSYG